MVRCCRIKWLLPLICLCLLSAACMKPAEQAEASLPAASAPPPSATPQPTAAPAPTPTPTLTPSPGPTPFTMVWMTDTQLFSYEGHPALESMGQWVADNIERENLLAVLHTGDLVDYGGHPWQWENFDRLLQPFYGKIPFCPVAGNHDLGVKRQNYKHYLPQYFLNAIPTEQKFVDGAAFYELLSAGGTDFIILGVGYEAAKHFEGVYDWIDGVLAQHRDRVGIVLLHRYIDGKGEIFSRSREIQDRIIRANANVRLVLCGHSSGFSARYEQYDDDGDGTQERTVCALMYNIKDYRQTGYFRLLRFDPQTRSIKIETYSPYLDQFYMDAKNESPDFVIENAF